jgi:hypothetical protein
MILSSIFETFSRFSQSDVITFLRFIMSQKFHVFVFKYCYAEKNNLFISPRGTNVIGIHMKTEIWGHMKPNKMEKLC